MYAVLAAVGEYPTWWPQVRSVERIDADSAVVAVRSVLPYTLRLVLTRDVEDPDLGVLRVRVGGDLSGWSQWEVLRTSGTGREDGAGARHGHADWDGAVTVARFSEQVQVTGALGLLAGPAAPLLRANHRAMMGAGARGLARLLGDRS